MAFNKEYNKKVVKKIDTEAMILIPAVIKINSSGHSQMILQFFHLPFEHHTFLQLSVEYVCMCKHCIYSR